MVNVLVTCIGSGVGQSVLDSLNNVKHKYKIFGCDSNRNLYATAFVDEFIYMPYIDREKYTDYVIELCQKYEIDILVPGHDFELNLFSKAKHKFEDKGIKVLVSEPKLIEISRNKQDWYDFFSSKGCNIVPTISVKEFKKNPDKSILPAIVKPAAGSASQGITIINNIEEIDVLLDHDIIQPYLFPEENDENYKSIVDAVKNRKFVQKSEISVQILMNIESKFCGIFISKNQLKNGIPVVVEPIQSEEFEHFNEIKKFIPILEENKVVGPVNIQGRVTPKGLFFFEMNMRFTGITGNRALLGFNEVDFLIQNFLEKNNSTLTGFATNKIGVRQVACTTIPKIKENFGKPVLAIFGAGSNVGQKYISDYANNFEYIYIIARDNSIKKYSNLFLQENISVISLNDPNLHQILCKSDVFINFASALAFESDLVKFDAIRNVFKLLTIVNKANIPLVINLSSQSVYSQIENKEKNEMDNVQFDKSYSFQKLIIEDFCNAIYSYATVSKVVSLRLPRILNPSNVEQCGFFAKVVSLFKKGETIDIPNPLNNTNLIHIKDVVDAIQYLIMNRFDIDFPATLNVSGSNLSLREYCEATQEITSGTGKFDFASNGDIQTSSMIDGSLFESYGWKSNYTYKMIIDEINTNLVD
jgi:carbamoylphosphate synthase large subunit/nucleoside-diphosphate-sugar epimerase